MNFMDISSWSKTRQNVSLIIIKYHFMSIVICIVSIKINDSALLSTCCSWVHGISKHPKPFLRSLLLFYLSSLLIVSNLEYTRNCSGRSDKLTTSYNNNSLLQWDSCIHGVAVKVRPLDICARESRGGGWKQR